MAQSKYDALKVWLKQLSKDPKTEQGLKKDIGTFLEYVDKNPASNNLLRVLVDNTSLGDVGSVVQGASTAYLAKEVHMMNRDLSDYLRVLQSATIDHGQLARTSERTVESIGHSVRNIENAAVTNMYAVGISGALLLATLATYFGAKTYRLLRPNQNSQ